VRCAHHILINKKGESMQDGDVAPTFLEGDRLAALVHEINRAYCSLLGDDSQESWDLAPEWQRDSALAGIDGVLGGNGPGASHASWCAHKFMDGWVYGEVKDTLLKTHPCLVPYPDLPVEQRMKDYLFVSVIRGALALEGVEL
jgi:hypothetical protein